jgi:hypothetical protein
VRGTKIRTQQAWWFVSYYGHLVLLTLLDAIRYVLTAFTLAAHRLHTKVAEHGETVADVLDATHYREATDLDRQRYSRLVRNLLYPEGDTR